MVLRYTGGSASCKIGVTATTITSAIGAYGAETADAAFGTAGTVTLSGYATLSALVTYLNTGNYVCTILQGANSASTTTPGPIAVTAIQAAGKNAYIFFKSTTSGVYLHQITPDLSQNERPSYSILKEGYGDNLLYTGNYINELSLSASLKGYLTGEATILGFSEAVGQTASGLPQPAAKSLVYQSGTITIAGVSYPFVRSFSWKATNNMFADGYGMGSLDRQYVLKSKFAVTGDMQLRLDTNAYGLRQNVFTNGASLPTSIYFSGGSLPVSMFEAMIMEMPYLQAQKYEFAENSGILDAKLSYQLFNPGGYDGPLTISLITGDSFAY
jgi:Phage tail tube protein